jgi:branched-chain amino acid transport system substrate-binding protein
MRKGTLSSKWMVLTVAALMIVAFSGLGCQKAEEPKKADAPKEPIVIGGIFDTTGPTAGVGKDYAQGALDAADYINANGGVDGAPVELIANDYAYKPDKAVELYKGYKDKGIFLIQGWGTGDTNALKGLISKDEIVYISASYDSLINDPAKTPYNFYASTSYGDAIRAAMQYVNEAGEGKKVVFIYPDHPYGKNPIPAGKAMAEELGLEVGPDQSVSLGATDAVSQLTNMKKFNPDWAWIGGTVSSTAVIIKDAVKLGLDTKFLINVWGFDENLPKLAGDAVKGRAYGMGPFAMWGADVPGMAAPMAMHTKKHPDDSHTVHYIQGWSSMMVMWEALKKTEALDGASVKAALETIKDLDTGGLTAPVTYTSTDHRPNTTLNINMMDAEGKIVTIKTVTMERRPEWLGQ